MPVRHACAIQSLVTDAKNAECWLLQDSDHLSPDAFKPRSSADGDWDAALSILFPPAGSHSSLIATINCSKSFDVTLLFYGLCIDYDTPRKRWKVGQS